MVEIKRRNFFLVAEKEKAGRKIRGKKKKTLSHQSSSFHGYCRMNEEEGFVSEAERARDKAGGGKE